MAFKFAHLLSAACGGAPHRLRRLRRPCALGALSARPCCGFWASWGAGSARFVPDFDVSGKTAEPKMAFNFAHLLSAACGGAPRRLGRLRRPCGSVCRWRYTAPVAVRHTATLWRAGAGGGHDYAVEASTSERVASVFTKMGVPSPASIRSGVTVPGALVARSLEWQQRRRPRLSSRRRGAEGWPTGGAVLLQAPPIGQPSDRRRSALKVGSDPRKLHACIIPARTCPV